MSAVPSRKRISGNILAVIVTVMMCALLMAPHTPAQKEKVNPAPAAVAAEPAQQPQALTAADVNTFFDGMIPTMLEHSNVAGAVVLIVKDGNVMFSKGYGYADVKTKKPVSVDDTLFRPGSVSKLFTCTAVMQLVEQGKLDLDRDVNDYIDFKIPATYAQPVTLRRIMTHTAGFEEWGKDLFVPAASDLEPLNEDMPNHLPARIFPPGTMPAYSNYAMTLAGYIVQRVSGEKFEDYIANHIFKPLNMAHSSFVQPLPDDLKALMSSGYAGASAPAKPFEFVNGAPAGALTTSAGDIAHFMIAHLENGRYGDVQILRPETAQLMHSRAFGPEPELNGMALAFFQENQNGHTVIGHGGDTRWFHSHLSLILDANTGFFISLNSAGRGDMDIRGIAFRRFMERYFPGQPPLPAAAATAKQDSDAVAGYYITSRRDETTFLKLQALLTEVRFQAQPDGMLVAAQLLGPNGQPRHWREIGPLLYRAEDFPAMFWFKRNSNGRFDIFTSAAAAGFQGVSATQTTFFVQLLFYSGWIILALTLLGCLAGAMIRRHYGRKLEMSGADRRWRLWSILSGGLILLVVLGWFLYLSALGGGSLDKSLDPFLDMLHIGGWLAVIAALIVIFDTARSLFSTNVWAAAKLWNVVTALGCVALLWFAWMCHLLSFSTRY